MKKVLLIAMIALFGIPGLVGQNYITKNGNIRFYSEGKVEKIDASNRQVNAAMNSNTGDFVFKILMKSFQFEKALMQEHFNENYVESDKYPNATFLGKITNIKEINFSKEGIYPADVAGKLTIHGVTHEIKEKGSFEVKKEGVQGKAKFNITLADYNISIPAAVVSNIAKTIEVSVDVPLEKFNK
jgi:polyisoprenoid-binding protein YceI